MNKDEYSLLFHKLELNRVAFNRLMDCDDEVLKLVNAAIEQEREACANYCEGLDKYWFWSHFPSDIARWLREGKHK
jgi:hypothetical protein